jgi:hypothetical protein
MLFLAIVAAAGAAAAAAGAAAAAAADVVVVAETNHSMMTGQIVRFSLVNKLTLKCCAIKC